MLSQKDIMFGARYGGYRPLFNTETRLPSRREAERMIWAFTHPFGPDLRNCKETNS